MSNAQPSLLAILPSTAERHAIRSLAERHGWRLTLAEALERSTSDLAARHSGLLLYDRDTPGFEWREAIALLAWSSPSSCIILVSSVVDQYLWQEVVHLGGYDVVTKPLNAEALAHTVGLAWSYYCHKVTKSHLFAQRKG
jgi:DNA-binding NtrC family response regulator